MNKVQANDLQSGDVLLYRASDSWKNAISLLIRKLDGTEASHAGLYLGDSLVGESLIVGNPGLNTNPLQESIAGCDWVEVRRLSSVNNLDLVMAAAQKRLAEGNRYGFDQILLVASICVAHKIDLGDGLLRKIVYGVLQKANEFVRLMSSEGREPMICSEFVYRAYDEALLDEDDEYSLTILSQAARAPRRRWGGRRRRERLFGAQPEVDLPTIEPGSLLAQLLEEPEDSQQPLYAAAASVDVTESELETLIYEWTGERAPLLAGASDADASAVGDASVPEISSSQVESMAREFITSVADAPVIEEADKELCRMAPSTASPARKALPVIADYVTPGDLLQSPSLKTVGRLYP